MKYLNIIMLVILVGLVNGCMTVGPDYQQPEAPTIDAFSNEDSVSFSENVDMTDWWKKLNDPCLDGLIEHAVTNNYDIRVAVTHVIEARANRGIVKSAQLPSVGANASATALQISEDGLVKALLPAEMLESFDPSQTLYGAGFDASWEIDIFGRVRRSIEVADAEINISESEFDGVMVILLSEVVRNYVELRMVQTQMNIINEDIALQQKTLDIITKRFEQGMDIKLNVTRTEAMIANTKARVPLLKIKQKMLYHRLSVLLGETPDYLNSIIEINPEIPTFPENIVVGIPADLLRCRPDICMAERNLASQVARIGIAKADFYPSLSLNGTIGLSVSDLGDASLDKAWYGTFGPSFKWALFEGGAIRSRVAAADARAKGALAMYEKTVVQAYEEVENALVAHAEELNRRGFLQQAESAVTEANKLSQDSYTQGIVDYINVLDTQRELLETKELLVISDANVTYSVIDLYKTFGGGLGQAKQ
jgi:NodT family efflux transporter outer membrane factor (OMF) lipoprotein